jgi:hypothetical protein
MNALFCNEVRGHGGVQRDFPLAAQDFAFLAFASHDYQQPGICLNGSAWEQLRASFADLPVDTYLPDGASYRFRRFGRFSYDTATGNLLSLPDRPFLQAVDFNRLNGGVARRFAPLSTAVRHNETLYQLVRFHATELRRACPDIALWKVYVHQIRIAAWGDGNGRPTPEGVHQDGHYFVAQVLIARENVTGAESRIFTPKNELITRTTLTNPLDTLLVNDRAVFHEVTELHCQARDKLGYRDMLLIDFNPYDGSDET